VPYSHRDCDNHAAERQGRADSGAEEQTAEPAAIPPTSDLCPLFLWHERPARAFLPPLSPLPLLASILLGCGCAARRQPRCVCQVVFTKRTQPTIFGSPLFTASSAIFPPRYGSKRTHLSLSISAFCLCAADIRHFCIPSASSGIRLNPTIKNFMFPISPLPAFALHSPPSALPLSPLALPCFCICSNYDA